MTLTTNLKNNFKQLYSHCSNNKEFKLLNQAYFVFVLKSNAYNQEINHFFNITTLPFFKFIGVSRFEEAYFLRQKAFKGPILMMGQSLPHHLLFYAQENITFTLTDKNQLDLLDQFKKTTQQNQIKLNVFIKIDTGMNRLGLYPNELESFLKKLKTFSFINVEGVMTHFSCADNVHSSFTSKQLNVFVESLSIFKKYNYDLSFISFGNSATFYNFKSLFKNDLIRSLEKACSQFNNVRVLFRFGIFLHGHAANPNHPLKFLKSSLEWSSKISQSSRTHAFFPVGTVHGISSQWPGVIINNCFYPFYRVTERYSVLETRLKLPLGSNVKILSKNPLHHLDFVAKQTKQKSYEIMNRIHVRSIFDENPWFETNKVPIESSLLFLKRNKNHLIHNYNKLKIKFPKSTLFIHLDHTSLAFGVTYLLSLFKDYQNTVFVVEDLLSAFKLRQQFPEVQLLSLQTPLNMQEYVSAINGSIKITFFSVDQYQIFLSLPHVIQLRCDVFFCISPKIDKRGFCLEELKKLSFSSFQSIQFFIEYEESHHNLITDLKIFMSKYQKNVNYKINLFHLKKFNKINKHVHGISSSMAIYGFHHHFKEALSFFCRISQLKNAQAGSVVSYGNTYTFRQSSQFAVLPVGYADGFSSSSFKWPYVMQNTHKFKLIGSVCMDQCMILDPYKLIDVKKPMTLFGPGLRLNTLSKKLRISPLVLLAGFFSKRLLRF